MFRFHSYVHDREVAIARGKLDGKGAEELNQDDLRLRHGEVLQRKETFMLGENFRMLC